MLTWLQRARRLSLRLAGASIVAALVLLIAAITYRMVRSVLDPEHVVEIVNRSPEMIAEAVATVCPSQLRASNLLPGGTAMMRFVVECGGSYEVRVTLASGATVVARAPAAGAGHDVVTVGTDGAIRVESRDLAGAGGARR